ncbi:hypothetical protein GCM10028801_33640 [Nocardioides maradonensis]
MWEAAGRRLRRGSRSEPVPELVEDLESGTRYGEDVDAWVARAEALATEDDDDHRLVREHLDLHHHGLQAGLPDLETYGDPVAAFLAAGASAKAAPEPGFSMAHYLERHPERRDGGRSPYVAWLREGRAAGEIADPADSIEALAPVLGLTPQEVAEEIATLREDMTERLRTGTLGAMLARAAELEPLIDEVWPATTRVHQIPFRNEYVGRAAAAIHAAHDDAGLRPARLVLVVGRAKGAAARRAAYLTTTLAPYVDPDQVLLLYTDRSGLAREGLHPAGVREVDLAHHLRNVGPKMAEEAFVGLLRSLRAEAVVGADSELMLRCLEPYGRPLAASERMFLSLGVADDTSEGWSVGAGARWLYPAFDHLAGVMTGTPGLRDDLIAHYLIGPEDAEAIRTPKDLSAEDLLAWILPGSAR